VKSLRPNGLGGGASKPLVVIVTYHKYLPYPHTYESKHKDGKAILYDSCSSLRSGKHNSYHNTNDCEGNKVNVGLYLALAENSASCKHKQYGGNYSEERLQSFHEDHCS
jgi:hypothetical protein